MVKILDEIMKELPKDKISSVEFEAANIVVYTNNAEFLFKGRDKIRTIVSKFKKRIELRADNSLLLEIEKAKEEIMKILSNVQVGGFKFDTARSKLIIEVDNVGAAVGKEGANLKEIQRKTMWSVVVKRIPPLRSKVVDAMRAVEFQESEYRRKFLNRVGKRIYGGWTRGKIKGWSRITILGGGSQIGRSAIYLQTTESRILFDCGIDPSVDFGNPAEFPHLESPEFRLEDVDAIVISHAHMDHCGLLPYLYRIGYKGPVYCTEPTRDIMALSQTDFIKIMTSNSGVSPIYKVEDIKEMIKHVIPLDYNEVTDIAPDVRLTFYNAGHILGSAFCHVNIGNGSHNFMYTGDFNYSYKQRLLNAAVTEFPRLESMMMECTNAGPKDYSMKREEAEEEFLKILIDAYVKKSKILIPVFGIGRSQEMLLTIENLIREGRLPEDLKVYIDGMVGEVTAIHTAYPEYLNKNIKGRILKGDNPFTIPNFIQIGSGKERQQVFDSTECAIVLATSGMLNGGTSVEYFKNFAESENNGIVFVGYQAEGTLGRRIKNGEKDILLSNTGSADDRIKVNFQVYSMHGAFSGHSDIGANRRFLSNLSVKPKKVILNHGELSKIHSFSDNVKKLLGNVKVYTPENLESIRLQ
ncbi:MAG: beta-CASP ribonuclease aCPSF1 [Candidatus Woesearchaeota archaeon]|jgi:KH/beta-lactamase-domain protein|nr:beta-CASP ribonuclease aCPSF1 [Candidatus Woesearchaeota archaeon]